MTAGDPRECYYCQDKRYEPIKSYDWPPGYPIKNVPFKKLRPDAKAPTRNLDTDAGIDLYALEDIIVPSLFNRLWEYCYLFLGNFITTSSLMQQVLDNGTTDGLQATKVKTGIALEIPQGMYGKIEDRSSMGSKLLKTLGGVIDSEYRGDVTICLANLSFKDYQIKAGDKVAQIIIQKCESLQPFEVEELEESNRGTNGFGSSGA